MEKQRFEFYVAGVQHHNLHSYLDEIEVGFPLNMVPEPENKYDHNAVKLVYCAADESLAMIGYVPGKISATVTAFIRVCPEPVCIITELNKEEKPWKQIKVIIREYEDGDAWLCLDNSIVPSAE